MVGSDILVGVDDVVILWICQPSYTFKLHFQAILSRYTFKLLRYGIQVFKS